MLTVDPKRRATLTDVLRSRWMRADGMEFMVTTLPALSTAPTTLRPVSVVATSTRPPNPPQAKSTALPTFRPNDDISTFMPAAAQAQQYRKEPQTRHSYHPPGAHELRQQEYQHQTPQPQPPVTINTQYVPLTPITTSTTTTYPVDDQDDMMSDVSAVNSPTETMATISPSTPAPFMDTPGGIPYRDPSKHRSSTDDKHHPYKAQHARTMSSSPDNVTISMSPSSDTLVDGIDSSKKKRKALTKLRQFFRFENKV